MYSSGSGLEEFAGHPLNTSFPRGGRKQIISPEQSLIIDKSAYKLLTLSTIANLSRIAEEHPKALRYFPPGSKLSLGAGGDRGDYMESSSVYLHCSLQLPSGELVGKEHISLSNSSTETAFRRFLTKLEKGSE
jgi:hypothetical protein